MTNPDDPSGNLLPVDAKTSIEMMTDNAPADGTTTNSVIASLVNAGDYKDNIFFTFTITKGDAVFLTTRQKTVTVKANPAFVASTSFIDTSAETGEIEAYPTVNTALSDKTAFHFAAVPAKKDRIALSVTSDDASADGRDADTVVATLTDTGNQPVAGEKLKFELPPGSNATFDGDPGPVTVTTDAAGQASTRVTLKATQDTTVTVTCSQSADASVNRSIDTHFKAVLPPRRTLTLSVTRDNAPANGSDYDTVAGLLLDQNQAPVAGEKLKFELPPGSNATFDGDPGPVTVTTDAAGQASTRITLKATQDTTVTVTCSQSADASVNRSIDTHFKAVLAPRRKLTLRASKDNAPANGTDYDTVIGQLVDQNQVPVAGELVSFDVSPPNSAVSFRGVKPPVQVETDKDGRATVQIADGSGLADTLTVVGTLVSDSTVNNSVDIQFVAVTPPQRSLTLRVTKNDAAANGVDADTLAATLLDQNDSPVAGASIQFDISPPSNAVRIQGAPSPQVLATDSLGQATIQVTDSAAAAGAFTVTATLVSDTAVHDSANVRFAAVVTPPRRSLTLQVTRNNATANGVDADTLIATLLDQNDNPAAGENIRFDISPPNDTVFIQGGPPPRLVATDSRGEARVQITDSAVHADSVTVVASLASDSSVRDSAGIQFVALVNPSPPPPPPPPQNPTVSFYLERGGITQSCLFPSYDAGKTARADVYLKTGNGSLAPYATVFLSLGTFQYVQPRIVALQGRAIAPTTATYATADQNGRIQVNIAQWPGPNQYSATVSLYANFSGKPQSGPSLPIAFRP